MAHFRRQYPSRRSSRLAVGFVCVAVLTACGLIGDDPPETEPPPDPNQTTITAFKTSAAYIERGDEVTLSSTVAVAPGAQAGTPGGLVDFKDGDTSLGTAAPSDAVRYPSSTSSSTAGGSCPSPTASAATTGRNVAVVPRLLVSSVRNTISTVTVTTSSSPGQPASAWSSVPIHAASPVPETAAAWREFSKQVFAPGAIDAKTKQLIAVAVAHVTQCPYCIQGHTKQAKRAGATPEELMEAIWVAAEMRAGGAYAHSVVALDAFGAAAHAGEGHPGDPR